MTEFEEQQEQAGIMAALQLVAKATRMAIDVNLKIASTQNDLADLVRRKHLIEDQLDAAHLKLSGLQRAQYERVVDRK